MGGAVALVSAEQVAAERARLTPALRRQILFRDGHRCKLCGAEVASGAALHVDHIVPIARGGTTEAENLRALCSACNSAKSSKLDHEDVVPPKRKSPKVKKTCTSCDAFHLTDTDRWGDKKGECHLRGPSLVQWFVDDGGASTEWPKVTSDNFCLDHTGLARNQDKEAR